LKSINTIINGFLKNSGLSSGVNQQKAIDVWNDVVGKSIAENTEVLSVEHGVLFIRVSSSSWSQELQLKKKEILLKVNNKIGNKAITDLRFV
jgi:predicted nucleic acid-binding Zn ribbon protein